MNEVWRPAVGFETSHEVSNLGRVRTVGRICVFPQRYIEPRVLALYPIRRAYLRAVLCVDGVRSQRFVHRLVADAFLGAPPSAKHEINHIDGNKANNQVDNLEWVTRPENLLHAYRKGLSVSLKGESHGRAKLTAAQINEIRTLSGRVRQHDLAERYGVSQSHISRIILGKKWNHV